jgi:hypothetical protein
MRPTHVWNFLTPDCVWCAPFFWMDQFNYCTFLSYTLFEKLTEKSVIFYLWFRFTVISYWNFRKINSVTLYWQFLFNLKNSRAFYRLFLVILKNSRAFFGLFHTILNISELYTDLSLSFRVFQCFFQTFPCDFSRVHALKKAGLDCIWIQPLSRV